MIIIRTRVQILLLDNFYCSHYMSHNKGSLHYSRKIFLKKNVTERCMGHTYRGHKYYY